MARSRAYKVAVAAGYSDRYLRWVELIELFERVEHLRRCRQNGQPWDWGEFDEGVSEAIQVQRDCLFATYGETNEFMAWYDECLREDPSHMGVMVEFHRDCVATGGWNEFDKLLADFCDGVHEDLTLAVERCM